jgi:hypothetical protein
LQKVNLDKNKLFKTSDGNNEIDVYTLLQTSIRQRREYNCLNNAEKESELEKIEEFLKNLIILSGQKHLWELGGVIAGEIRNQNKIQADSNE